MTKQKVSLNAQVTTFLDNLEHPLRKEIEQLRQEILTTCPSLMENIKWNGPNYHLHDKDRITMKIQPPRAIQLIFHRGAKVLAMPKEKLISDDTGLLVWRANDRAVATFKSTADINQHKDVLSGLIQQWIAKA
ncbi:DUF1801 domain-containing protein [Chitinophaga flava]|uniref:DUF1801 domain-containing protein n=1 Tax=Chitinophaga flava TaxID=2259036 RepID=A0A365Y1B1_9BACT|nr:DUF1801 domain-containing protein [Chitinophaga flava]RBL92406.1 DUF1801 domain-containing protein [Chitinophaga flava]